ncbi:hypothetical protein [Porphyromonas sp. COT-290 OH860]|uniref:hypothetical protein n=1 Tax=Porphyromonas sp. COT-290 OH860 TaxID=1515615 RepID=UPI00052D1099|nr:hypothetical protein [Porphyromonas sp. COT-290 OH860]KGN86116.1 hypothetical protein HQ41_02200 [Porphyromonas sp. COT-290 OH860]
MKRITTLLLCALLLLCSVSLGAQSSAYQRAMTERTAKLDSASIEVLQSLAADFDRFTLMTGADWTAPYYSAYCRAIQAFADSEAADRLAEQAEQYLEKATELGGDASEIACLRSMLFAARLQVNPQTRWQIYGPESAKQLQLAQEANPNNPRVYLLQAQSVAYTPAAYGGGKDKALPSITKALELYTKQSPEPAYAPHWGEEQAKALYHFCTAEEAR